MTTRAAVAAALWMSAWTALTPREAAAQGATEVTPDARALVARCATEADPGTTGIAALEAACPGLGAAMETLGLRRALIDGADATLDAGALDRLLQLTRPASHAMPDPSRLASVMEGLRGTPENPTTWQRFKRWIERTFLSPATASAAPWLQRWLERLTPGRLLRDVLVWSLLLVVVGAAATIVVRELRAAGVRWNAPWRRRESRAGEHGSQARHAGAAADDWRRLPPREQPAALFRAVAGRLAAAGRLPLLGSHTHRELRREARLDGDDERAAWEALAGAAERQIYSASVAADDAAASAVATAARLWSDRA